MIEQAMLRRKMTATFAEIKLKNPSYTLRAYARKLKISHSAISEILNGKRRVSQKLAARIIERLDLSPSEAAGILNLFEKNEPSGTELAGADPNYVELSTEHFHVISDWYHFAILSLSETETFRSSQRWIAKRLGIKMAEAEAAVQRLEKLEMIERRPDGTLRATGAQYSTPDDIKNIALRKLHAQNLELARRSIERDEVHERDFTALTLTFDPEMLPLAKKMIREFQDVFEAAMSTGKKKEVFKLCFQLFPLSRKIH